MTLSFGGLSLLYPWTPFHSWDTALRTRAGFRSFICALVVVAVVLILGELSHPSFFYLGLTFRFLSSPPISVPHKSLRNLFQGLSH
ncbi:hypothetical protein JVU11DRAFT_2655 [Chiua virens]|nr:hypothetical protein JVU11DRAFT_2655 [Chiua virens]